MKKDIWDSWDRKGSKIQSIWFKKSLFSVSKAKKWLKSNGFEGLYPDLKTNIIRFRQLDPKDFVKGSFRTGQLAEGVYMVVGIPKSHKKNPKYIEIDWDYAYKCAERLFKEHNKQIRDLVGNASGPLIQMDDAIAEIEIVLEEDRVGSPQKKGVLMTVLESSSDPEEYESLIAPIDIGNPEEVYYYFFWQGAYGTSLQDGKEVSAVGVGFNPYQIPNYLQAIEDSSYLLIDRLYNILVHEFTHFVDTRKGKATANKQISQREYILNDREASAFLQQILVELFGTPERLEFTQKILKKKSLEDALPQLSEVYRFEIFPFLEPEELEEFHIEIRNFANRKQYISNPDLSVPSREESIQELLEMKKWREEYVPNKVIDKENDEIDTAFYRLLSENGILDYSVLDIKELGNQVVPTILFYKNKFKRQRPYQLAEEVGHDLEHDYLSSAQTYSYPSGHTTQAVYLASVLGERYPFLQMDLNDLAYRISASRIHRGVHYPSDIVGGVILGKAIYEDSKKARPMRKNKRDKDDQWIQSAFKEIDKDGTAGSFTRYAARKGYKTVSGRKQLAKRIVRQYRSWKEKGKKGHPPYTLKTFRRALMLINLSK